MPNRLYVPTGFPYKIWRTMELGDRTHCPYAPDGDIKGISQSMQVEEIKEG